MGKRIDHRLDEVGCHPLRPHSPTACSRKCGAGCLGLRPVGCWIPLFPGVETAQPLWATCASVLSHPHRFFLVWFLRSKSNFLYFKQCSCLGSRPFIMQHWSLAVPSLLPPIMYLVPPTIFKLNETEWTMLSLKWEKKTYLKFSIKLGKLSETTKLRSNTLALQFGSWLSNLAWQCARCDGFQGLSLSINLHEHKPSVCINNSNPDFEGKKRETQTNLCRMEKVISAAPVPERLRYLFTRHKERSHRC